MGPLRALLVDDEPQVLTSLGRLFRRHGFVTMSVSSGQEALAKLETFEPDVLVSDYRMAGMDGAQLMSQAATKRPRVRRVLLSGFVDLQEAGAPRSDAILLPKPWDEDQLIQTCRGGS